MSARGARRNLHRLVRKVARCGQLAVFAKTRFHTEKDPLHFPESALIVCAHARPDQTPADPARQYVRPTISCSWRRGHIPQYHPIGACLFELDAFLQRRLLPSAVGLLRSQQNIVLAGQNFSRRRRFRIIVQIVVEPLLSIVGPGQPLRKGTAEMSAEEAPAEHLLHLLHGRFGLLTQTRSV